MYRKLNGDGDVTYKRRHLSRAQLTVDVLEYNKGHLRLSECSIN